MALCIWESKPQLCLPKFRTSLQFHEEKREMVRPGEGTR